MLWVEAQKRMTRGKGHIRMSAFQQALQESQCDETNSSIHLSSKLVDPASDHILRSKTKPCMSKTKQVVSESAYGSINEP